MFNNIGYIVYKNEIINDEEILEIAIDVGADDVSSNEQTHEIITSISEFNKVREKLDDLLGAPEQAELVWLPENYVLVDDLQRATSILKLIDTLDTCDDVQGVYGNFEINEETLKLIEI